METKINQPTNQPTNQPLVTEPWGKTTDPNNHDPKKFRYLIHGIMTNKICNAMQAIKNTTSTADNTHGDQSINLLDQPHRVSERISLSMSLIDQDHLRTFGNLGLILEVPECNIIKNSRSDLGSWNCEYEHLLKLKQQNNVMKPDDLMTSTGGSYNEVLAFANYKENKIKVIGFFANMMSDGQPKDSINYDIIKNHARNMGLPLIEIKQKSIHSENKIVINSNDFFITHNNKLYTFFESQKYNFYVRHENFNSYSISPSEMEGLYQYLKENNFPDLEIKKLKEEYKKYDEEYHKPQLTFDENENINFIKIIKGHGPYETTYSIYNNNFGQYQTKENLWKERFSNDNDFNNQYRKPLTLYMIKSLIDEIKSQFDQKIQEKLENFKNGVKNAPKASFEFDRDGLAKQTSK